MGKERDPNKSKNADGKHVHSPESGRDPDDALAPGNTSGSGDVERAQREQAIKEPASAPIASVDQQPLPEGKRDAASQAKRILDRNRELLEGAEPGVEGEERIAGGHTENSEARTTGDYSND